MLVESLLDLSLYKHFGIKSHFRLSFRKKKKMNDDFIGVVWNLKSFQAHISFLIFCRSSILEYGLFASLNCSFFLFFVVVLCLLTSVYRKTISDCYFFSLNKNIIFHFNIIITEDGPSFCMCVVSFSMIEFNICLLQRSSHCSDKLNNAIQLSAKYCCSKHLLLDKKKKKPNLI